MHIDVHCYYLFLLCLRHLSHSYTYMRGLLSMKRGGQQRSIAATCDYLFTCSLVVLVQCSMWHLHCCITIAYIGNRKLSTPLRGMVSDVLGNSMSEASSIYEASLQKMGTVWPAMVDTHRPCTDHMIPATSWLLLSARRPRCKDSSDVAVGRWGLHLRSSSLQLLSRRL